MSTLGDRDQIKPLSDFAAKGVFTKELDIALLNGDIDLAVRDNIYCEQGRISYTTDTNTCMIRFTA